MAKTKIICDGVNRVCFTCKKSLPIECYHLRGSKKGTTRRDGRCKICVGNVQAKRNRFLFEFHKSAKLLLDPLIYQKLVENDM